MVSQIDIPWLYDNQKVVRHEISDYKEILIQYLHAVAEESENGFPVHEDTKILLFVPFIDDLINRCLNR